MNDVYVGSFSSPSYWTKITSAAPWYARRDFAAVSTDSGILLFGGRTSDNTLLHNDVWFASFDNVISNDWQQTNSYLPFSNPHRSNMATASFGNTVVMAGGAGAGSPQDVWVTSSNGKFWTCQTQNANLQTQNNNLPDYIAVTGFYNQYIVKYYTWSREAQTIHTDDLYSEICKYYTSMNSVLCISVH
jgi:hypothetical protein